MRAGNSWRTGSSGVVVASTTARYMPAMTTADQIDAPSPKRSAVPRITSP